MPTHIQITTFYNQNPMVSYVRYILINETFHKQKAGLQTVCRAEILVSVVQYLATSAWITRKPGSPLTQQLLFSKAANFLRS